MMQKRMATATILAAIATSCLATSPAFAGDAVAGKKVYNRCVTCHSFDPGARKMGPHLKGLFGRKAGTVEGARYSKAMKESGIVWSAATLDGYLANPRAYLPGTTMSVGVSKAEDRANLIAYLKDAS